MPGSAEYNIALSLVSKIYMDRVDKSDGDIILSVPYQGRTLFLHKTGITPLDDYIKHSLLGQTQENPSVSNDSTAKLLQELTPYTQGSSSHKENVMRAIELITKAQDKNKEINRFEFFVSNIKELATFFYGEVDKDVAREIIDKFDFSNGCCFGQSSSYIQACLVNDSATFLNRLKLLKRNPTEGWNFWGQRFHSLPEAIKTANEKINSGAIAFKDLPEKDPDTFMLLEMRPFIEQLLAYQSSVKTSLDEDTQDIGKISTYVYPEAGKSIKQTSAHSGQFGYDEMSKFLQQASAEAQVDDSPKLYMLTSGAHAIVLQVNKNGFEVFDQNFPGLSRRKFNHTSHFIAAKCLVNALQPAVNKYGEKNALIAIKGCYDPDTHPKDIAKYNRQLKTAVNQSEKIIDQNNVNDKNSAKISRLYLATQLQDRAAISKLLKVPGIDVNAINNELGATALHFATANKDKYTIKALIKAGADITIKMQGGHDAIGLALSGNDYETASVLLDSVISNRKILYQAIDQDNPALFEHIVTSAIKMNCLHNILKELQSTVNYCMAKNASSVLQYLLKAGINHPENDEVSLLAHAAMKEQKNDVVQLLTHGADFIQAAKYLMVHNDLKGLETLLQAADNIDSIGLDYFQLLGIAIETSSEKSFNYILDRNPELNLDEVSIQGYSPLCYAAEHSSPEIVSALLKAGVSIDLPIPESGWTPLLVACNAQRGDNIKALLEAGADVNQSLPGTDWDPLSLAAYHKDKYSIDLLLLARAKPSTYTLKLLEDSGDLELKKRIELYQQYIK